MAEEPALEVIGLSKRYGDRRVVDHVNLVVRPGEVHGLLGPNGAGKTTFLRMLLGLVRPDDGTARLLGCPAGHPGVPNPAEVSGFADSPRFYPYLSGRRNLRLLSRLDSPRGQLEDDKVREVLDQVGLAPSADAKVSGYSAGMRQRLGLAAALLRSPRLLLLDEPTTSLDPAGASELRAHVRRLAADGVAVLWSSHDMAEVEDLCAALTILHHGRVAFSGTLNDLRGRAPATTHRIRTSDDVRARTIGEAQPGLAVSVANDSTGLDVRTNDVSLDAYVLALGRAGIAVRALESRDRSLEALFLTLTADGPEAERTPSPPSTESPSLARHPHGSMPRHEAHRSATRGVLAVTAVESAKVAAHFQTRALLAVCLLGPFVFALAVRVGGALPEDTLFGRWVKASGLAVPLVVLGFAAMWAFPALTSVVAGDLFSSEDRYGTWPTLLTRSRSRAEIIMGKTLTGIAFSVLVVLALATSSMAAGLLLVGKQPLLGLSGTLLPPQRALTLCAYAWATVLPPVFGFTCLAILISTSTRSSAAGIGLPVIVGFVMQLSSYLNGPSALQRAILTPAFVAWHGLFTDHPYYGPLFQGTVTSALYLVACLTAVYAVLERRDMGA
jgi:ABC-2 type transport system ATP-binding protein